MVNRERNMVIWRDIDVVYQDRTGVRYLGDVPIANWNSQTNVWEKVVNPRGRAYAARKRMSYRK